MPFCRASSVSDEPVAAEANLYMKASDVTGYSYSRVITQSLLSFNCSDGAAIPLLVVDVYVDMAELLHPVGSGVPPEPTLSNPFRSVLLPVLTMSRTSTA